MTALAEAMALKRQQEQIMDFVGHEIRNPLSATSLCANSILTTLEDLMPTEPTAPVHVDRETVQSQMENAEIIATCIQHQKRIIDDVLTLSKLDTGLLIVTPCETKPVELVGQSRRLFDAELQQADRLLQILINLVTNAIRFTKNRKKRVITVTISASKERPTHSPTGTTYLAQPNSESGNSTPEPDDENSFFLMLAVQDTGIGMKPHELQRIFKLFQQSSHKTHMKYGGSGLGLFISRELARLQGGQICVASTYGNGSTFEFYIRANKCPAPDPSRGREGSSSTVISSRAASTSLTPCRIDSTIPNPFETPEIQVQLQYLLLVEDNLVNQKVMEKQLKKAGYFIKLANHGGEALEHLRKSTFCDVKNGQRLDIVLMDVEKPIMGGLECTSKIREMQEKELVTSGKHVPIIAITANTRGEQQTQALDARMDSVVTKPFQMNGLLSEMERVFRLSAAMSTESYTS
ncbi:Hybrid signal transduction histidine kinase K [Pseudocercospora fuligena]|uniref:Hybrid signal transduction histidine kinase K n=1 Tax=Pseudocercospora fuligena TaxID=685502 RepID=A0A8H6RIV9_9PEZI|nr:Hybrid signal transduction histidine kinase K [Pseudocercospora fuligena]